MQLWIESEFQIVQSRMYIIIQNTF